MARYPSASPGAMRLPRGGAGGAALGRSLAESARRRIDVAPSLGISPGEPGKMVSEWEMIYWLVVWNIFYTWFILPYIENNHPN